MNNYIFELDYNNMKINDIDINDKKIIKLNNIKYKFLYGDTEEIYESSLFFNLFFNNNKLSFKIKNINSNNISYDDYIDIFCVNNLVYVCNNNDYSIDFDINNIKLKLFFSQDNNNIFNNNIFNNVDNWDNWDNNNDEDCNIMINLNLLTLNYEQKNYINKKEFNSKEKAFEEIKKLLKNPNYFFDFDIDIMLIVDLYSDLYTQPSKYKLDLSLLLRNIHIYEIKNKIIELINENNKLKNENDNNNKLLKELK